MDDANGGIDDGTHARIRFLGAAATLLSLGGITVAVLLDPTFSWTGDALSDLGVRDRSAPVFNWGLILGGLVGVGYAVEFGRAALSADGESPRPGFGGVAGVLRAVVLALSMVALAGVGAFDLTHPLHGPAAIGFYTLATVVFALDGVARRETTTGWVVLGFVPVHLAVWATFVWGWWPVTGLALPELPGALMLAAWVWAVGPAPVLGRGAVSAWPGAGLGR